MIIIGLIPFLIILLILSRGSRASRRTNKLLSYHPAIAAGIASERRLKFIVFMIFLAIFLYANRQAHAGSSWNNGYTVIEPDGHMYSGQRSNDGRTDYYFGPSGTETYIGPKRERKHSQWRNEE